MVGVVEEEREAGAGEGEGAGAGVVPGVGAIDGVETMERLLGEDIIGLVAANEGEEAWIFDSPGGTIA